MGRRGGAAAGEKYTRIKNEMKSLATFIEENKCHRVNWGLYLIVLYEILALYDIIVSIFSDFQVDLSKTVDS